MFKESQDKSNQPEAGAAPETSGQGPTHYDILGLPPTATEEEIHKAWRALMAKEHTDRGGDPERSKYIGGIWLELKDPVSRAEYDRELSRRIQQKRVSAEAAPAKTGSEIKVPVVNYKWTEMEPEQDGGRGGDARSARSESVSEAERARVKAREERLARNREELERMKAEFEQRWRHKPGEFGVGQEFSIGKEEPEPETRQNRPEAGAARIKKIGNDYYLVDAVGRELSSAYDNIAERDGFLIGRLLSSERLLDGKTGHALSRGYNKIFTRDGLLIGRDTEYEYPIHPETGQQLSMVGYEKIEKRDKKIIGKIDGREQEIKIHEKDAETHRYSAVG